MTILYPAFGNLYVNLTNRCPCACTFCLRQNSDSVYGSDPLWLEHEPSVQEVIDEFQKFDLSQYGQVVFCGYGEPTERLDDLLEVARYLRSVSDIHLRINTNGLADLIWQKPTAPMLEGLIDSVSISLNASNAEDFLAVTVSKFGIESYDAMLQFARECTQTVSQVIMSIVDVVTSKEEQARCLAICEEVGATLRIRPYEEG